VLTVGTMLHEEIRSAMLAAKVPTFDKRRRVAELVDGALRECGDFCRTQDGRLFFFSRVERRLHDLDQRPFQHLLTSISGLSSTESTYRFVLDMLQATTARTADVVEVQTLAAYDMRTGTLAVSDGAAGVWVHERGAPWTLTYNGDNGLLFMTEPDAQAFVPELDASDDAIRWYLDLFTFAQHHCLSRDDQQTLYTVFLMHQFFPALRRTRATPVNLGPQGSGKTTALRLTGRLMLGPGFEVTGLQRDKEDAFVSAITNRTVVGLDNADSRVPWLPDALATYATGRRYQLRKLYTTNEEASFSARAIVLLSSRDPHFNRPDVAERLLPFHFARPLKYQSEAAIFDGVDARRGAIMGALLRQVAAVADRIDSLTPPPIAFRMADYAAFGWRLFAEDPAHWEALLGRLERAQAEFASDGDGMLDVLRVLYERDGQIGPISVSDLYAKAAQIADEQRLAFPRTATGFGRRLTNTRRVIELELGARWREETRHKGQRWISLAPEPIRLGDVGEVGDVVGRTVFSAGGAT
jgi:hypothetical protein